MKKLIIIFLLITATVQAQYSGNNGIVNEYHTHYDLAPRVYSITDYGATNDSTVNSTTAIQRTIDSANANDGIVYFPPGNYTSAALTIPAGMKIKGDRAKLNFLIGQTGNLLTLAKEVTIEGLTLDGGNYTYDSTTAESNRTGINMSGATHCNFTGITITGFNEKGIEATNSDFCKLTNSRLDRNHIALFLTSGAEYWTVTGTIFQENKFGAYVRAGNNAFNGCIIEENVYGAYVIAGSNEAHGSFTGCLMNHNTTANVYVSGITLPELFINCAFYSGRVWAINSVGFGMAWCQFGAVDIIMDNVDGMLKDCIIQGTVTFSELNAGTLTVSGNINQDGSAVSWND